MVNALKDALIPLGVEEDKFLSNYWANKSS